jgi:hypothetical protein
MKYVHQNHDHVYYVSRGLYNYSVRQWEKGSVPGKLLEMDKDQYKNFEKMLKDGGWNEQSTFG